MNNIFDYAKDDRTVEKYQKDFEVGVYNQNVVLQNINKQYVLVKRIEKFNDFVDVYEPDVFIRYGDSGWYPFEVRTTNKPNVTHAYFKPNQLYRLSELGGYCLWSDKVRYFVLPAQKIIDYGKTISAEESKFNKESIIIEIGKVTKTFLWKEPLKFKDN